MTFRESLARWICPELGVIADRDARLRSEISMAYRWLAEFDDIRLLIDWLRGTEQDYWRKLSQPPACKLPGDIGEFREVLRALATKEQSPAKGER